MKKLACLWLLILGFAVVKPYSAHAQAWIRVTVDSLSNDTIYDNGSIHGIGTLYNDSIQAPPGLSTNDTALTINASYKGNQITAPHFIYFIPDTVLQPGQSVHFQFIINNPDTSPLPQISPGGGSVVVWPVYQNTGLQNIQPATFTIYYVDTPLQTGVVDENKVQRLVYNNSHVELYLKEEADARVELYDASGRLLASQQKRASSMGFYLEGLAPGVYIIRLQSGRSMQSFKFVHY